MVLLKRLLRLALIPVAMMTLLGGPLAASAYGQEPELPKIEDFIDENGVFDEAGYLAALAEVLGGEQSRGGGEVAGGGTTGGGTSLPLTGSDIGLLVGVGSALVVLGSGAVVGARQRRAKVVTEGVTEERT
jgi:hypothetical protein